MALQLVTGENADPRDGGQPEEDGSRSLREPCLMCQVAWIRSFVGSRPFEETPFFTSQVANVDEEQMPAC